MYNQSLCEPGSLSLKNLKPLPTWLCTHTWTRDVLILRTVILMVSSISGICIASQPRWGRCKSLIDGTEDRVGSIIENEKTKDVFINLHFTMLLNKPVHCDLFERTKKQQNNQNFGKGFAHSAASQNPDSHFSLLSFWTECQNTAKSALLPYCGQLAADNEPACSMWSVSRIMTLRYLSRLVRRSSDDNLLVSLVCKRQLRFLLYAFCNFIAVLCCLLPLAYKHKISFPEKKLRGPQRPNPDTNILCAGNWQQVLERDICL